MGEKEQNAAELIPITAKLEKLLKDSEKSNLSLFSQRVVYWSFKNNELKINKKKTFEELYYHSIDYFKSGEVRNLINKRNKYQKEYLNYLEKQNIQTFSFNVETSSPFITGLGAGHPTETGIILDRNTGVPYIPATSIKGVLRVAHAINVAKQLGTTKIDANKYLEKYFGYDPHDIDSDKKNEIEESTRGQLVILDTFPYFSSNQEEEQTLLIRDIMTPHFSDYYSQADNSSQKGKHGPEEKEKTNPIPFIVVASGTRFTFRCAYIPLNKEDKCNEEDVKAMFKTAFETVGFGAKTAIGYGRFKEIE